MEEKVDQFCAAADIRGNTMTDDELLTAVGAFLCIQAITRGLAVQAVMDNVFSIFHAGMAGQEVPTVH